MVLNEVRSGFFASYSFSPTSYSLWLSLFHLLRMWRHSWVSQLEEMFIHFSLVKPASFIAGS